MSSSHEMRAEYLASLARQLRLCPAGLDQVQILRMISTAAESMIPQAVEQARAEGETWADIGLMLGVSKQAAIQRYSRPKERAATDLAANLAAMNDARAAAERAAERRWGPR